MRLAQAIKPNGVAVNRLCETHEEALDFLRHTLQPGDSMEIHVDPDYIESILSQDADKAPQVYYLDGTEID